MFAHSPEHRSVEKVLKESALLRVVTLVALTRWHLDYWRRLSSSVESQSIHLEQGLLGH